jgi:hypothetical protein
MSLTLRHEFLVSILSGDFSRSKKAEIDSRHCVAVGEADAVTQFGYEAQAVGGEFPVRDQAGNEVEGRCQRAWISLNPATLLPNPGCSSDGAMAVTKFVTIFSAARECGTKRPRAGQGGQKVGMRARKAP